MWMYALAAAQLAGGIMGYSANKKQGKIAAQVAKLNTALIELETETNIVRLRQQARKLVGTQKSLYAKGGVVATSGSAYEVAMETQILAEQDVMLLAHEGKIRAAITRQGGQAQQSGFNYAATASLFDSAADAAQTYAAGS